MPWCAECDRFLSPPSVTPDGSCPACGRPVDPGRAHVAVEAEPRADAAADDEESPPIPWHFKVLVGAIALYLGWRAWQGIEWLVHRFGG